MGNLASCFGAGAEVFPTCLVRPRSRTSNVRTHDFLATCLQAASTSANPTQDTTAQQGRHMSEFPQLVYASMRPLSSIMSVELGFGLSSADILWQAMSWEIWGALF